MSGKIRHLFLTYLGCVFWLIAFWVMSSTFLQQDFTLHGSKPRSPINSTVNFPVQNSANSILALKLVWTTHIYTVPTILQLLTHGCRNPFAPLVSHYWWSLDPILILTPWGDSFLSGSIFKVMDPVVQRSPHGMIMSRCGPNLGSITTHTL